MKDRGRNRFAPERENEYTDITDAIIEDALLTIESQIDIVCGKDRKWNVEKGNTDWILMDLE